jgi:D-serine deaminase-like pyridoxal phosphate-dependent protein
MTPFEEELRQALNRDDPGVDFTARVLARCAREDAQARRSLWRMFWTPQAWRLAALAAGLLVMAGGTAYEQHEHEARGMAAKRQLLLAMRIAGTKLQQVQERVKESEQIEQ